MLRRKLPFFLAYAKANNQPIFIDYIEITKYRQYIDTGVVLSHNHKVTAVVKIVDDGIGTNHIIFGNLVDQNRGFSCACADKVINSCFDGTLIEDNLYRGGNVPHTYTVDKNGVVVDDEPIKTWQKTPNDFTTIGTCLLSGNKAANNATGNHMGIGSRIYDFKVWENDTLIQHLRPCLHPETFEACMYDMVTKQYFYNKGTGSFIPAPRFVEYIEFDGASYIDTGLFPNSNWRIESVWLATVASKNMYSSNVQTKRIFGRTGGTWWFGDSIASSNNTSLPLNTVNTTAHDKNGVIFNGVSYAYDKEVDEFDQSTDSLCLGALKTNLPTSFEGRIYDFKIYDNDVLIQHLRPCLRGNTPCMYDMVKGKYYMNIGTGAFGYGELGLVEYLESTGTQYINTDYIMTSDNQEVECEFQYIDSSSTQCLFGTLPGDNRGITAYTSNDANFYVHTGQPVVLRFFGFDYSAKHSLYVKAVVGQGVYGKLDNEEQTTALALTTINKSNAYFLFCRNNGTNNKPDTSFFKGRISKYKMYDNGVLVRDMRPCINPSTNEACMYDMVTGRYFANAGTGAFEYGKTISA